MDHLLSSITPPGAPPATCPAPVTLVVLVNGSPAAACPSSGQPPPQPPCSSQAAANPDSVQLPPQLPGSLSSRNHAASSPASGHLPPLSPSSFGTAASPVPGQLLHGWAKPRPLIRGLGPLLTGLLGIKRCTHEFEAIRGRVERGQGVVEIRVTRREVARRAVDAEGSEQGEELQGEEKEWKRDGWMHLVRWLHSFLYGCVLGGV